MEIGVQMHVVSGEQQGMQSARDHKPKGMPMSPSDAIHVLSPSVPPTKSSKLAQYTFMTRSALLLAVHVLSLVQTSGK